MNTLLEKIIVKELGVNYDEVGFNDIYNRHIPLGQVMDIAMRYANLKLDMVNKDVEDLSIERDCISFNIMCLKD